MLNYFSLRPHNSSLQSSIGMKNGSAVPFCSYFTAVAFTTVVNDDDDDGPSVPQLYLRLGRRLQRSGWWPLN